MKDFCMVLLWFFGDVILVLTNCIKADTFFIASLLIVIWIQLIVNGEKNETT